MKRYRKYLLPILIVIPFVASAQNDSIKVLPFESFMDLVKAHHPITRKADLQLVMGDAAVMNARGAFDPKLYTDIAEKHFNDEEYYRLIDGGLKIPTWFGVELRGGYEQNEGIFLNPEDKTPGGGLMYGGISVPVGQGLFIDERRAALRSAKLFQEITFTEQQLLINELMFEAGKAYWQWFNSFHVLKVYQEALALADQRLSAVKRGAALGDRPSIDTLEAGIQVQNRLLNLQEAQLDYANSTAYLSVFLWQEGFIPLEIANGTVPVSLERVAITSAENKLHLQMDSLILIHPRLQQYNYEIDRLTIERQWKREQLKPTLNLKYNALAEPINEDPLASFTTNNYTFGLEFSMPLFLRKERGSLKLANAKIQESELDLANNSEKLLYAARSSLNEWNTTEKQIILYERTVEDYQALLSGESRLFNAGESSLFLVNSRELGYINAQVKLIELLSKNHKARLATLYAFGILNTDKL